MDNKEVKIDMETSRPIMEMKEIKNVLFGNLTFEAKKLDKMNGAEPLNKDELDTLSEDARKLVE